MKIEYEKKVLEFSEYFKQYSKFTGFLFSAICIYIFGTCGYHAGDIGGAILFTIFGMFFGLMVSNALPEAIIQFLGTKFRFIIFIIFVVALTVVTLKTNSLLVDSIIVIATYLYLLYLHKFKRC